jgi:hypothetical protein
MRFKQQTASFFCKSFLKSKIQISVLKNEVFLIKDNYLQRTARFPLGSVYRAAPTQFFFLPRDLNFTIRAKFKFRIFFASATRYIINKYEHLGIELLRGLIK